MVLCPKGLEVSELELLTVTVTVQERASNQLDVEYVADAR